MSVFEGSKYQEAMERRVEAIPEKEVSVFGANLKEVIEFLGMNQTELAIRSGLTQSAISQIINGEREPSLKTVQKILNVIPVSFERLMK